MMMINIWNGQEWSERIKTYSVWDEFVQAWVEIEDRRSGEQDRRVKDWPLYLPLPFPERRTWDGSREAGGWLGRRAHWSGRPR